jgi:hypothetical protein
MAVASPPISPVVPPELMKATSGWREIQVAVLVRSLTVGVVE